MKIARIWGLRFLRAIRTLGYKTAIAVIVVVVSGFNFFYAWQPSQKVEALDSTKMIIFWDGTDASIPTGQGWSKVTAINGHNVNGEYPRGETPANVVNSGSPSTYGGTATHAPAVATTTINTFHPTLHESGAQAVAASSSHVHTTSAPTPVAASNEPVNRSLKMITHTSIPTTIPAGGIIMFDAAPGAGWTRLSAQDNAVIKIDASTTGSISGASSTGSDAHTHSIPWNSLTGSTGTANRANLTGGAYVPDGHTHAAPTSSTTPSMSSLPPHIKPLLYQANADIAAPNGMITIFDNNPGGGWAVQSNTTGIFYQQFIRPASTFVDITSGAATHSHASITSGNTVTPTAIASGTQGTTGPLSTQIHYHTITSTFTANTDNLPPYFNVVIAKKALPGMLVFWDGTDASIPAGWTKVTTFEGRLPRGESPANYGDLGGAGTGSNPAEHKHAGSTFSVNSTASTTSATLITGTGASSTHAHASGSANLSNIDYSASTAANLPAYRTLKLIRYTAGGIPTEIKTGMILIFDNSPGIPTTLFGPGDPYWSQYAAQDNKVAAIDMNANNTVGSTTNLGTGSDNHTHVTTWAGTLANTSSSVALNCVLCGTGNAASTTHNHTLSGNATSANGDSPNQTAGETVPPHVKVLLAKANHDVATISLGLIAMFDGDPGSGWVIRSSAGGTFHKRFLRSAPAGSYSAPTTSDLCEATFGCDYHNHTVTKNSNGSTATANNAGGTGGAAANGHTHSVTSTFTAGNSDAGYTTDNTYFLPAYFNVVIAEKVDFKQSNYRWFDNSNTSEDVSSGWSSLDVLADSTIPTLPADYSPPMLSTRLRLRVKIQVNNANLAALEKTFRFQYKKSVDSLCDSTSGWADVGVINSGEVWRFANSSITDGTTLTQTRLTSDVKQVYVKSNPTALNVNAVTSGQYMEYDFHLEDNGAPGASQYSFRVVEENGTLFSEYTNCPTLVTAPDAVNQMRHGNFFEESAGTSGRERGFFWAD